MSSVILLVVSFGTTALGQNVYAHEEQFIVRVHATGQDDDAGRYKITVTTSDGTEKSIAQDSEDYPGEAPAVEFVFDAHANPTGEEFTACITSLKQEEEVICQRAENTEKQSPEDIYVEVPDRDDEYYEEGDDVIVQENEDGSTITTYPQMDNIYPHVPEDDTYEDDSEGNEQA